MKWDAVFFDFDGVILDSVYVKTEAFAEMFRAYGPEVEKAAVDYHLKNGGVSRFEKFRYYYEQILKKPIDDKKIDELAEQFSKLVLDKVLASAFIPGAMEALQKLKKENIPSYVVSGTPHDEINLIIIERNLLEFFIEMLGSPRQKHEIIDGILKSRGYQKERCLFIGDAMTDYSAAKKTGVCFLGIVKQTEPSPFPDGTRVSSRVTLEI